MTTIAWDGEVLASDSLGTWGDTPIDFPIPKIARLDNGDLYGMCGNGYSIFPAFRYWNNFDPKKSVPKLSDGKSFTGCIIRKANASFWVFSDDFILSPCGTPWAIGSGADVAMGAMDNGANSETAVKLAMGRDVFTAGLVQKLKLNGSTDQSPVFHQFIRDHGNYMRDEI